MPKLRLLCEKKVTCGVGIAVPLLAINPPSAACLKDSVVDYLRIFPYPFFVTTRAKLLFIFLFYACSILAEQSPASSIDLKDSFKLSIVTNAKSKISQIRLLQGKKVVASEILNGVTAKKPTVMLKKAGDLPDGIQVIEANVGPVNDTESAPELDQIILVKRGKIILGPSFEMIGQGDGGALRVFDYSMLKTSHQIRVLVETNDETLKKHPSVKVVRHENGADGPVPLVVESTYTWNGRQFDYKAYGL